MSSGQQAGAGGGGGAFSGPDVVTPTADPINDRMPAGSGNKRTLDSWAHLNRRLSEAYPRNMKHTEQISLGIIHSPKLRKRGR